MNARQRRARTIEVTGTICGAWFGFTMALSDDDIEDNGLDLGDLNNNEMRRFLLDDFNFRAKVIEPARDGV